MELLIIIGYGILINIIGYITGVIFLLIGIVWKAKTEPFEFAKGFTEVEVVHHDIISTRDKLIAKRVSPFIQDDLVILLPYSGILVLLELLWYTAQHGVVGYLWIKLSQRLEKLQNKLINT